MAMAPRRRRSARPMVRPVRANRTLLTLLSSLALSPIPASSFSAITKPTGFGIGVTTNSDGRDNDCREPRQQQQQQQRGAISLSIDELCGAMGSRGRARIAWDCYRVGIDPALFFGDGGDNEDGASGRRATSAADDGGARPTQQHQPRRREANESLDSLLRGAEGYGSDSDPSWRGEVMDLLPTSRRSQGLGRDALARLAATYPPSSGGRVEGGVASLSHLSRSSDGTTKLLLRLSDGMEVETVIIPWSDKGWSTLCVSSQVGCRQGCTFCATGRMGRLRNLSSDEILAQFFFARKVTRLSSDHLPEISNVVFMGMGEPTDNADEVNAALRILTDVELFHMGRTKVTVSTVAPGPDAFAKFADSPCVLAWSVHAADDELRRKLVPTTRHTVAELRRGLVDALLRRPPRLRATMLEVALMADVNDSTDDADELADLALSIMDAVPDIKLVVNCIPFNDIGHPSYRKPSGDAVKAFQDRLWERGVFAHVRTTRGDDESAACGQLATKKRKGR